MAKEQRENKPAKVRIFFGFAEVEGGDQTVQEGVRSIAAAVVRAVQPTPLPPRQTKALPSNPPNGKGKNEQGVLFNNDVEQPTDDDTMLDAEAVLDQEPEAPSPAAPKEPRIPKKAPTYTFVKDLNLRPTDKDSLKAFFEKKKPGDQQEQILVFIYYLQKILGITGITANHLYQCFKDVEKRTPKDILQNVRNTGVRKGWIDTSDGNNLRVVVSGENFVEHDLPPKSASQP